MRPARKDRRVVVGTTLIAVGLALFLLRHVDGLSEGAVLLLIAAGFFVAYALRRSYGFLVPAGVLSGLAAASFAREALATVGDPDLLGLALGFLTIYVVSLLTEKYSRNWPLYPAAFLALAGLSSTDWIVQYLIDNWPLILVAIGVLMLLSISGRPGAKAQDPS